MPIEDILYFDFNHKSSVLLIFFFNAIMISVLLFVRALEQKRQEHKWLSLLVLLGGLYISPFMLGYAGWYSKESYRHFLFFMPLQQVLLIGPVILIYIQSLLDKDFKVSKVHIAHFAPSIFYGLYSLVVFITDYWVMDEFYFYADNKDKDLDLWYQIAGFISMSFYFFLSYKVYINYRHATQQELSFADKVAFKWIQHFLLSFALLLALRLLFFALNPEWGQFGQKYWYYLCFSLVFLYIAMAGYSNAIQSTISLNPDIGPFSTKNKETADAEGSHKQLDEWKQKITALIVDDLHFTNPTLTLTDVASLLNTNRNVISQTINQGYQMNFNDFINKQRVEAVAKAIQDGEVLGKTILAIAYENGFNSKSTFLRSFKKFKGETASQFSNRFTSK